MSPTIATFLTLAGILWLLRRDVLREKGASPALWLPVLWLAITGTRFVSQWLELGQPVAPNFVEGSPIDAAYFASLILLGVWVLSNRRLSLGEVVRNNAWLALLILYGLLSVTWSDDPAIAIKRWIKTMGHPLMALVILSDPDPARAVKIVLRRCAYFFLPLSVLFIKYLPEYGRSFDAWTGEAVNNGVGLTKNDLGYICMVSGLIFFWQLSTLARNADGSRNWREIAIGGAFVLMALWLLNVSNSATSLACLMLGATIIVLLSTPFVSKRYFGTLVVAATLIGLAVESSFGLYATTIEALGRNPSLTDRTVVWEDVLGLQNQPLIGYGFESFWLGTRLEAMWAKWWWQPTQAHNGYIETYLNLGAIGLVLLGFVTLAGFRAITRSFADDLEFGRLRMGLLFAILAFNVTEAAFKGTHFVWTIFYIVVMHVPRRAADESTADENAAVAPAQVVR
jgi:exopolysaccharide production protein ExoQ